MRRSLLALVCVGVLAAPSVAAAAEGDVIVRFRDRADAAERTDARVSAGVRREDDLGIANLELVDVQPGVSQAEAIAALEADDDVAFAEPDVPRSAYALPNDTFFDRQWGLLNTGQSVGGDPAGTPGADIRATQAWDLTTGSPSVVVAIVDSGTDLEHLDLAPNLWSNPGEDVDGVDDDGNGFADDVRGWDFVQDDNRPDGANDGAAGEDEHGTHVAGTVAARGNNAEGVTGVAWATSIMPVRALDETGQGACSDIVAAMGYAVSEGADIVNLSLGGAAPCNGEEAAIANARDVLFVAAAGNGGGDQVGDDNDLSGVGSFPCEAAAANLICVAASDQRDLRASFSNFGDETVDLAAPGVSIASTVLDDQYAFLDGTSMATPHVSGAAALLFGRRPDASAGQVRSALLGSVAARPAFATTTASGGRLDARAALDLLGPPPAPPAPPAQPAPPPAPGPAAAPPAPAQQSVSIASLAPPDRSAPVVRVGAVPRRGLRALLGRGLKLRIRCSEACRLSAEARRGTRRLTRTTARRSSAGTVTVTLRLTRADKRRLRRLRRLTLRLRVAAADAANNRADQTVTLRLRR